MEIAEAVAGSVEVTRKENGLIAPNMPDIKELAGFRINIIWMSSRAECIVCF